MNDTTQPREGEEHRKAMTDHCERIEREAAKSLIAHLAGWAPTTAGRARAIIKAIRDGKVAHVRIDY